METSSEYEDDNEDFEDFEDFDIFDGDFEIEEYNESYSPFKTLEKKYTFPKPIINIEKKLTLSTMFSKPTVFKLKNVDSGGSSKKRIFKLCKYIINNQKCPMFSLCKYAHEFYSISKCNYDNCKKTKLVGPATFINTNEKHCKLRHHLEDVHSFLLRTNQYTSQTVTVCIFSDNLQEYLEHVVQQIVDSKFVQVELKII